MAGDYNADVCIVGGGPAGMMLGLLLAHQGINVLVLELHQDFEREYRGEVLMPRFTQMMRQIGLYDYLEKFPHLKLKNFELLFKDKIVAKLNFSNLCPEAPFAIWMPQTILLNALHEKARTYPHFKILFKSSIKELSQENGAVVGLKAEREGEIFQVRARVVVGADGRFSAVRKLGRFEMEYENHDFDVIWFTVKKNEDYENTVRVFLSARRLCIVLPKYPDLVQCGLIVPRGEFLHFKQKGIVSLQKELLDSHPVMYEFAAGLKDFSPFNVLQAKIAYVKEWAKDGCLLVGDAAHTCSPAGAIGVAVAVKTAIVAADILGKAIKDNDVGTKRLGFVQAACAVEVKKIQGLQKRFTALPLLTFSLKPWFSLAIISLMAKTGVLSRLQKQIAVADKPLPIDAQLRFNS